MHASPLMLATVFPHGLVIGRYYRGNRMWQVAASELPLRPLRRGAASAGGRRQGMRGSGGDERK